jgi:MFS family permease
MLSFAALGVWVGVWSASVPQIQRQSGLNDGQLGLAILIGTAFMIPIPLVFGFLSRRFGGSKLLPVSLFAYALFGFLPSLSNSFGTLIVGIGLTYLAVSLMDATMNAAVAAREHKEDRHLMQLAHSLYPSTLLVATFFVGILRASHVSLLVPFLTATAIFAVVGVRSIASPVSVAGTSAQPVTRKRVHPRSIVRFCAIGLFAYSVETATGTWAAVHMEQTLHSGPFVGALAPGTLAASAFAGRLLAHRFSDRGQPILMLVGVIFCAIGLPLAALAPSQGAALLAFALVGIGYAPWSPAIFSQVGRIAVETGDPKVTGIVLSTSYVGLSVGPAVVGLLANVYGLRTALGLQVLLVAAIAAMVLWPMFGERRRAHV